MPRNKSEVIAALKKKGFENGKATHHRYYCYRRRDGVLTKVFTYTSHSGKELHDVLLSQMAKQCKLRREEFLKLVDCSMSRQEYEKELKRQAVIYTARRQV